MDYFSGFFSDFPVGPSIRLGVYPAFTTASHNSLGEGVWPFFGVTVAVVSLTSVFTDSTPATASKALETFRAQPPQVMSPITSRVVGPSPFGPSLAESA